MIGGLRRAEKKIRKLLMITKAVSLIWSEWCAGRNRAGIVSSIMVVDSKDGHLA